MLQTEFCGSDYKFVISWDSEHNQTSDFVENPESDENLFRKLDELYQNISKFSTEFVECMKRARNSSYPEQLLENNRNISFKIENAKNSELYSDEVYMLRKEVDKLKQEKEALELENKNIVISHDKELLRLKNEEAIKLKESEKTHENEMSKQRVYYEKILKNYLKKSVEVTGSHYILNEYPNASSNSENDTDEEIRRSADVNWNNEVMMHGPVNLQNIMKANNTGINKIEENVIRESVLNMEKQYLTVIEVLKTKINDLLYDKAIENKVKEIHSEIREEYQTDIQNLQNISDQEFIQKNNEKVADQLRLKCQKKLQEMECEWSNKIEELLSDILVNKAVKSVTDEMNYKRKQLPSSSPSKKLTNDTNKSGYKQSEEQLKQKHEEDLDEIRNHYEDQIKIIDLNHEKRVQELTNENKKLNEELKANVVMHLKILQADHEINLNSIKDELSKMKAKYKIDVIELKERNLLLETNLRDLKEKEQSAENVRRQQVISMLQQEIKDLIMKEVNGDCVTWPSELAALEQLFLQKFKIKSVDFNEKMEGLFTDEVKSEETPIQTDFSSTSSVNELFKETDVLKKFKITLYGALKVFTKYVTNCEEEINNTLIRKLVDIGASKKNFDNSYSGESICDLTSATEENIKKVHFAPDITEVMSFLDEELNLDVTSDHDVSVILESGLQRNLERLRDQAEAVLRLTTGVKHDADEARPNCEISVQTDFDGEQFEMNQRKMHLLEQQLTKTEKEIADLTREVVRLTEINSLESLEGYGEGQNSILFNERVFKENVDQISGEYASQYGEEFCPKCDKVIEEANRAIEDRNSQLQAATNKYKSLDQFLDRQTAEREHERADFDRKLNELKEQLKERERDLCSKYEAEVGNLQLQIKKLTENVEQCKTTKDNLEIKVKTAHDKISFLMRQIDDLENKCTQKSELVKRLEIRLKEKEEEICQYQREYQLLLQQIDMPDSELEELNEQHVISSAMVEQMKNELFEVEKLVMNRTRELENTYLSVASNNIVSSPSEDVSVCDRIGSCLRVVSPNGSDLSSSPIHVPINHLSCLHDKIKKLFGAEEAALKKIRDQDMQLNKLSESLAESELEKSTLRESLNNTSAKLSEAKIELNNWQHSHTSLQSEIQLEQTRTIESLELQIEYLTKCISQKDIKILNLTDKMKSSENYILNSEAEFKATIEKTNSYVNELKIQLQEQENEKQKLQKLLSKYHGTDENNVTDVFEMLLKGRDEEIKHLEQRISSLQSIIEESSKINSTDNDSKQCNSSNNMESGTDSDVSRHAAMTEISTVPHYISIVSSTHVPYINMEDNESFSNLPPVRFNDKFDVEHFISPCTDKQSRKNDSDNVHFNNSNANEEQIKTLRSSENISGGSAKSNEFLISSKESADLKGEENNQFVPTPKIHELVFDWEKEQKCAKDAEAEHLRMKTDLENQLSSFTLELAKYKEQCDQYVQHISVLTHDMQTKNETIDDLKNELQKLEGKFEEDKNEYKKREQKTEELNKAVVKERIEAQLKCEEFSRNIKQVRDELEDEKGRSKKLTDLLQLEKESCIELQRRIKKFEDKVEKMSQELQTEREQIKHLSDAKNSLQIELEIAEGRNAELIEKLFNLERTSVCEERKHSLRNLTEKVQKEVELAGELDQNILKSLESDFRSFSFIEALLKISSSVSEELKLILLKILQEGPEELTPYEKDSLVNMCNLRDTEMIDLIKQHEEMEKQLRWQIETEQNSNKKLASDNQGVRAELNRLELVLGYYDERMSFLVTKLDEYRNKGVKTEIELTSEKTSRRQLELYFENYKKEALEKQNLNYRKIEEFTEQYTATKNENAKLKHEIQSLKDKLENLTAEMNSMQVIKQYHSDSESDLSRTLNPLKLRLNELQEKYSKNQYDLERKKTELFSVKSNFNLERSNKQKFENLCKAALDEKHELQKQLVDLKKKYDDVNWQKQKLDDKLKAFELAEMRRRKLRSCKEGIARKEYEVIKEEQSALEKECDKLKKNLLQLRDECKSLQNDWKRVCEEIQEIFIRMLKAESCRRSLVFQKNCLLILISRYRDEMHTITQDDVIAMTNIHDYTYFNISCISSILTPKQKFKSFVFCVIAINRIRIIMKHRVNSNHSKMIHYFKSKLSGVRIHPWCTMLPSEFYKQEYITETNQPQRKKKKIKDLNAEKVDDVEDNSLQALCQKFVDLRDAYFPEEDKNTN